MPILREFAPQLLLISAGFDAALGDTQGKMRMSPAGFVHLTRELQSLEVGAAQGAAQGADQGAAQGAPQRCPIVALFEGGYHLEGSAECTVAVLRQMIEEAEAANDVSAASEAGDGGEGGKAAAGGSGITTTTTISSRGSSRGSSGAGGGSSSGGGSGGGVGSLGEHTELLLRKVIGVHKEHWSCLATTAHAEKVDDFFSRRGGRKRGRS